MHTMPKLVALERFFYNGRNVEKDETFTVEESDVAILTHHHTPKAKQPDRGEPEEPPPEPEAKAKAKAKTKEPEAKAQNYKTRDMTAED
jgi:hypothetical protein